MFLYRFCLLTVIVMAHHGAFAWSDGLSEKHLTIAGEYWEPYFMYEENSDGTETYRVVNKAFCCHYYENIISYYTQREKSQNSFDNRKLDLSTYHI